MPAPFWQDSSGQNSLDSNNFDSPLAQGVQHMFPFMPSSLTTRLGHFSNDFLYKISRPVNNFTNAIDPLRHLFKPVAKAEDWVQHKPADTAAIVGMAYGGGSALGGAGGGGGAGTGGSVGTGGGVFNGFGGAADGDGGGLAISSSGSGAPASGGSATPAASSPFNYARMGSALMNMGGQMQQNREQHAQDFMPVMRGHGSGPNPSQSIQPFLSTPQLNERPMPAPASGFGAPYQGRMTYNGFGAADQPPPY